MLIGYLFNGCSAPSLVTRDCQRSGDGQVCVLARDFVIDHMENIICLVGANASSGQSVADLAFVRAVTKDGRVIELTIASEANNEVCFSTYLGAGHSVAIEVLELRAPLSFSSLEHAHWTAHDI